jgi:hypothetical protein
MNVNASMNDFEETTKHKRIRKKNFDESEKHFVAEYYRDFQAMLVSNKERCKHPKARSERCSHPIPFEMLR